MSTKQEEKNQKILRSLLQLPDNKRCADCLAKGPVYANTTFNTFVCTTCSGIHREFSHRVKSISMASFKPDEITALQAGGNQAARQKWLANWSPEEFAEPDPSDQERIRQFIRYKYIDHRWVERAGGKRANGSSGTKTTAPAPKAEPLSKLLGNDLPPIRIDSNTQRHQEQKQPAINPFFDAKFDDQPSWQSNPFPAENVSQTQQHQVHFASPFEQQPFPTQTTQSMNPTPAPQAKATELKNQLQSMYQQQHQQQQQMLSNPMAMNPGMHMNPNMGNPMMNQGMQMHQMNPQMNPMFNPAMMNPNMGNPMMNMPMGNSGMVGMTNPAMGNTMMNPAMQMTHMNQMSGMVHPGMHMGQPGMMQTTPMTNAVNQSTPFTAFANPTPAEPKKPDPFEFLSPLSGGGKPITSATKPIGTTAQPINGNLNVFGTSPNNGSMMNSTSPNKQATNSNNDPFGFGGPSTSTQTNSGMNFGFPNGSNTNQHANNEFNPFGISQTTHLPQQSQQQAPKSQQSNNDFNPFF